MNTPRDAGAPEPQSRFVQQRSIEKRQRVLDAAARIMAERGYAEATLLAISAELDVNPGSLYYYFRSRQLLVTEVLFEAARRSVSPIRIELSKLPASASYLEQIRTVVRTQVIETARTDDYRRAYWRVIYQLPAELRASIVDLPNEFKQIWDDILIRARDRGEIHDVDPALVRKFVAGAINMISIWYRPDGALSPEQLADAYVDLVVAMLAKPSGRRGTRKG